MPERNPKLGRILVVLMMIVTVLSVISLVAIGVSVSFSNSAQQSSASAASASKAANAALAGLKQSSSRSECRTAITNNDEDLFRHRVGELISASESKDLVKFDKFLNQIRNETPTQQKIDKQCPAPLVPGSNKPPKQEPIP